MSLWNVKKVGKIPKMKAPILIEGLPGIGNVGKVAVDFLVDELEADMIYEFFSYSFPHTVFINEDNLVELPKIEMYHKRIKGNDFLFLAGDLQPTDETSCYEFCDLILDMTRKMGVKEIITLGGIGLNEEPKKPKIYCTANNHRITKRYMKDTKVSNKIHGVVGPIIGVSGVLVGLAEDIDAIALLAETLGHPMYLGIKGAKEILEVLNKKLSFNLNLKEIEKEILQIEKEVIRKTSEIEEIKNQTSSQRSSRRQSKEVNYIG